MIGLGSQAENLEVNCIKRPNVFRCIGIVVTGSHQNKLDRQLDVKLLCASKFFEQE